MFPIFATLAMIVTTANHAHATPWLPSNDPLVTYQWAIDVAARPDCDLRVLDTSPSQQKHVSISYRTRSGSRIKLNVRMNPGDPHQRIIGGCKVIDRVEVQR